MVDDYKWHLYADLTIKDIVNVLNCFSSGSLGFEASTYGNVSVDMAVSSNRGTPYIIHF